MALTAIDGYNLHIKQIEDKLVKFNTRLLDISEQKEYLFGVISSNESTYKSGGLDIDELVWGNRNKFNIRLVKHYKFNTSNESVLQSYIIAYMNLLRSEKVCIEAISQYSMLKVPMKFYKFVSTELNLEFSKSILMGNNIEMGSGVGTLCIKEKQRDFARENCRKTIDWKESNVLRRYLIAEGKIPYDKNTAPDGIKWHVYRTDDYSYWWWWKYRSNFHANDVFYKFTPTKFINGVAREIENFKKNFNTIEKILDTTLLGNIDKLYKIRELNPAHMLRYRANSEN